MRTSCARGRLATMVVLALVATAAFAGAPAVAERPRYQLTWSAPEACPDAAAVEAAIADSLGAALAESTPTDTLVADALVERAGERYRLRLKIGERSRELEAAACDELAATAAFIVAIAVDPRVLEHGPPPLVPRPPVEPEPDATPPRATDGPRELAIRPPSTPVAQPSRPSRQARRNGARGSVTRSRRMPLTVGGRVHGGLGLGPSPAPTGVLGVSVAALGRHLRIELEGSWWIPRRVPSPIRPALGLTAQLWTVGLRGCGVPVRGRFGVPLCLLVETGMIHAKGTGQQRSMRARQSWVGLGGGAMLVVRIIPRLAATVGADVLWSAVRGGFESVPSGDIDRVGTIGFKALGGLQWSLR